MPTRSNSRIEVDLKLLDDKNIRSLRAFGDQFESSIKRYERALQKEIENAGRLGGSRDTASGLSPNASTGANIQPTPGTNARMGGTSTSPWGGNYSYGNGGGGGGGFGGGYGGGPSTPSGGGGAGSPSSPDSFERQYVRAQRRIGEVPVGFRQALGYYAEGGPPMDDDGFLVNPDGSHQLDENGNPMQGPWSRRAAGRLNANLFTGQAVAANVRLGFSHLQGIYGAMSGPMMVGQQLGYSRSGILGTPFLSPAFKAGVHQWWNALKSSGFGFDPNYSPGQAMAAAQAVSSYGYSFQTADVLNEQLKHLQMKGMDPGEMMSMLDPLMRYGGWENGTQLIDVLRAIPEAAKAASFNLKTFTEQLTQTALEIAQQTGMQPGQVASALSSFSAVTGLAPSRAAGLFNANNIIMSSAMTGKSVTSLVENPQVAPLMAFGNTLFHSMTGMTADQLLALRKKDRNAYNQLMNPIYMMYESDPNVFGGLSPLELINMGARNNNHTRRHIAVDQQIRQFDPRQKGAVNQIEQMLKSYGPNSGPLVDDFQNWRDQYLGQHKITSQRDLTNFRKAAQQQALKILGDNEKTQGQKAAVAVTVEASPYLRKYLDLLTKTTGPDDVPSRNTRPAITQLPTSTTPGNAYGK